MTEERSERANGAPSNAITSWLGSGRRGFLRGVGLVSTVGLTGCAAPRQAAGDDAETDGEEDDGGENDGAASGGASAEVAAAETDFEPAITRIETGGSVTWTIEDGVHTVTAYHPDNDTSLRIPDDAGSFDSGMLDEGETFTCNFDVEGVYDYYCLPHEGAGMVASVIVGNPDPEGEEPGLGEPADDVGDADAIRELNAAAIEELGGTPPSEDGEGTDEEGTEDADEEPEEDVEGDADVSIPGREFTPDLVQVPVGETVRWTFEDDAHTVTAYEERIPEDADPFDSGFKNAGDTFEVTFDVEGVYDYYCEPHVGRGMIGSVIVGDPDPEGGEPGLAEPTQSGDEGSALESLNARTRERLSGEGAYETVDAEALSDADGEIDIQVRTDDGAVRAGRTAPIVARYEGKRLANAPVDVEGDFQGYTDESGAFEVTVPRDLDSGDECRIEIRVDGARGRIEVPVEA